MENNNNTQEAPDVPQVAAPEADVPQAEVEKVIAENGTQPAEGYKDLTEEQTPTPEQEAKAKEELKNIQVVENPQPAEVAAPVEVAPQQVQQPVEAIQPSVNLGGQLGSAPLDNQPTAEPVQAPQTNLVQQPINMKLLQFECDVCQFKVYVNLADDKLEELPEKMKCINCGKKKSIKRRIFDMTLNGAVNYVEPTEDTVAQPEAATQ